jgi:hypothetical protein
VVLLVLAIVWGVLLVSWLRSRTEGTFSDSVGTFRRHLTVLERAAPATVAPANRLRSSPVAGRSIPAYRPAASAMRRPSPANPSRRRQAQKRRRDVFIALLAGTVGSFLLAMIPGVSVMWSVQVLFDVLLVAYIALLVRLRSMTAERAVKLSFMPKQRATNRPRPAYEFGGSGYGDLDLRRAAN